MAIFAEVTENERIIDRHLRGIHPLLDYDGSESQSMISIWFDLIEIGLSALYGVMATQNWPTLQRGFSAIAELLVWFVTEFNSAVGQYAYAWLQVYYFSCTAYLQDSACLNI